MSYVCWTLIKIIMKYTKIAFIFAFALVVATAPASTYAITVQDNGGTVGGSVVSAPGTQDNGTTAGSGSTAPGTQDNGTTAGNGSGTPATQDNGTTAGNGGTTPPATQDNGTTAGTGSTPTPPPTPGPGVTSGGGSTSSSGSYVGIGGSPLPVLTNISQCNYLTTYMKRGSANSVAEVTKLQNFLRTYENMNIPVTGIFDTATFNAVSAFQEKYTQDILAPWGGRLSTGYVYITTTKKINEIYCKQNFTLTPAQVAIIEAYRTSQQSGTTPVSDEIGSTQTPGSSVASGSTNTSTSTGSIGTNPSATSSDSQVAAAAKTPIITKIWNFIKRIFGR